MWKGNKIDVQWKHIIIINCGIDVRGWAPSSSKQKKYSFRSMALVVVHRHPRVCNFIRFNGFHPAHSFRFVFFFVLCSVIGGELLSGIFSVCFFQDQWPNYWLISLKPANNGSIDDDDVLTMKGKRAARNTHTTTGEPNARWNVNVCTAGMSISASYIYFSICEHSIDSHIRRIHVQVCLYS